MASMKSISLQPLRTVTTAWRISPSPQTENSHEIWVLADKKWWLLGPDCAHWTSLPSEGPTIQLTWDLRLARLGCCLGLPCQQDPAGQAEAHQLQQQRAVATTTSWHSALGSQAWCRVTHHEGCLTHSITAERYELESML